LILNEIVELLVDRLLKLFMIIRILYDPVDCILLLVDLVGVLADDGAVLGDLICHQLLIDAEVVDLKTSLGVGLVIFHELTIQFIRSFS